MTERRVSPRRPGLGGFQPGSDFLRCFGQAGTAPPLRARWGPVLPFPLRLLALQGSRKGSREASGSGRGAHSHSWKVQSEGKVGVQGRVVGAGEGQRVSSWEGQWAGPKNLAASVDI